MLTTLRGSPQTRMTSKALVGAAACCIGIHIARSAKLGGCLSAPAGAARKGRAHREQQEAHWKRTGIVAVRDAGIKELPASLEEASAFGTIRTIDLTSNKIAELPAFVGGFSVLLRLTLSRNQLTQLPAEVSYLTNLKTLLLDHNKLADVPPAICKLPQLETLVLSNNAIAHIPSTVSQLTALSQLKLSQNQLSDLPPALGRCRNLREVDVSSNHLTGLPAELGLLKSLIVLSADTNNISRVPPALLHGCTQLSTLTLHQNPITFDDLEATDGYQELEKRRVAKFDKVIDRGAMLGPDGLAESVSRTT